MSLFDEIRLSFCNMSRHNTTEINSFTCEKHLDSFTCDRLLDKSFIAVGTQTEIEPYGDKNRTHSCSSTDTQTEVYTNLERDAMVVAIGTQTENELTLESHKAQIPKTAESQTDFIDTSNNNNNHSECMECEKISKYTAKLERDIHMSRSTVSEMQLELNKYEDNLGVLEKFVDEGDERNSILQEIIKSLERKIGILEDACTMQRDRLDGLTQDEFAGKHLCEQTSVSTQADVPCQDCEKRNAVARPRNLRRFLWTPLKCLFQLFAVLCFVCAISVLYGVSTRSRPSCPRDPVPWRWMDAQDIMDLLLRIEYVADVPM